MHDVVCIVKPFYLLVYIPVSTFSKEGCQQTADYVAEEEALQESNHPWLQDFGCGSHQYG